jgi:amidase
MNRRDLIHVLAGSPALVPALGWAKAPQSLDPTEHSIAQLQAALAAGRTTSTQLVAAYLHRIARLDRAGPRFRAVLAVNPDARRAAQTLDEERKLGRLRGPLHGIPILLKDNIESADPLPTTAGSLALARSTHAADAPLVAKLRAAGVVILGKTNLSEWANFRSTRSSSGWSGVGGQTRNAYDRSRNPSGSSSGSAVATALSLCAAAIGSETDGSILAPSSLNGIVGLKPTAGLVSGTGVVPISPRQDTAGPMGRSVADVALLAAAMSERPLGYGSHGRALDGLRLEGLRIGVMSAPETLHPASARLFAAARAHLEGAGAVLVELTVPQAFESMGAAENTALLYEFKAAINAYLGGLDPARVPTRTLADLIAFNAARAREELPDFGQELFEQAQACGTLSDEKYQDALATLQRCADVEGLAALLDGHSVDVLLAPGNGPADTLDAVWGDRPGDQGWPAVASAAAIAGYPSLTIPMGLARGLPVGLMLVARRDQDGLLLQVGHAVEERLRARVAPAAVRRSRAP